MFGIDNKRSTEILSNAKNISERKKIIRIDSPEIRNIKGLIRRCEASATCRYVGIPETGIHFMNLPFYETGTIEKKPMSEEDVQITMDLLQKIKPHQVYCAGDLADPHGTHKVCLDVVLNP